jgi:hypothetical protein
VQVRACLFRAASPGEHAASCVLFSRRSVRGWWSCCVWACGDWGIGKQRNRRQHRRQDAHSWDLGPAEQAAVHAAGRAARGPWGRWRPVLRWRKLG